MSGIRRIGRLLFYVRRYAVQAIAAVVLLAAVGLLDAFRVVLDRPDLQYRSQPEVAGARSEPLQRPLPFNLQQLVPSHCTIPGVSSPSR